MVPPLGDKKLKGFHPLKILTPALGVINILYGLALFFFPNYFLSTTCMLEGECLFRARASAQYATIHGAIWIMLLFMDRRSRYVFGWILAIEAFGFLANTNIGWALGFTPPQYDVLFSPAGAAYFRSFEAIFGFWTAIRAFEPEEGFAAAETTRKRGGPKSS